MTSQQQQHWHPEDIDDALVADFDGSLSGLCIMSLSFDFTRNSTAVAAAAAAASVATTVAQPAHLHNTTSQLQLMPAGGSGSSSQTTQEASPRHQSPHDHTSESSFKRFKTGASLVEEPHLMPDNNSKIVRQLQKLKSCLNAAAATNPLAAHLSAITQATGADSRQSSPTPSDSAPYGLPEEEDEPLSGSSSPCSSTVDARTPRSASPASSISSNTCSTGPSSQQSPEAPADTNQPQNAASSDKCAALPASADRVGANSGSGSNCRTKTGSISAADSVQEKQLSVYSVKDSLINQQGSTLKESSYTTSVITTSAPMPHSFKSIHHPFHSFKQFPLSPYQFSNSSLNHHDFYDRYLSQHDSHQPLQTPLIGIERTQDLLSLKLPPHGPEEFDSAPSHRFGSSAKPDWMFADVPDTSAAKDTEPTRKSADETAEPVLPNFAYAHTKNKPPANQREPPVDANYQLTGAEPSAAFGANKQSSNDSIKSQLFSQASKGSSLQRESSVQPEGPEPAQAEEEEERDNTSQMAPDSMFGLDASKQKFQYVLAAPISVATKLSEDTMTYLNQAQAYEIKLENLTDVSEAKKGFMCSIINIGFQERHMQQAENELWQQWSQQHPNEKIFSVDMKLSYNVFGVESDGLNKYEFLWDSSKIAGVFIRINSISTEFTPKKHGGEKGVPFKLSIETFSYNSKTHDSYFISAACCQIKVFKPKGAERKIRSDRDKISRRPLQEQDKYHGPSEHSLFRECSLASLHPMADGSLCYYRHSHGHFASKQVTSAASSNTSGLPNNQSQLHTQQPTSRQHSDDDLEASPNNKHLSSSSPNQQLADNSSPNRCDTISNKRRGPTVGAPNVEQNSDFHNLSRCLNAGTAKSYSHLNYSVPRLIHPSQNHYGVRPVDSIGHPPDYSSMGAYGPTQQVPSMDNPSTSFNSCPELAPLQQPNPFNHLPHHPPHHPIYHSNQVARTHHHHPAINGHASHFNMAYHYGHPPPTIGQPAHLTSTSSIGAHDNGPSMSNTFTTIACASNHFPHQPPTQLAAKSSLYHRNQPSVSTNNDINKPPPQSTSDHSPISSSFRASNLAQTSQNSVSSYAPIIFSNDTSTGHNHHHNHHNPTEGFIYGHHHQHHHQLAASTLDLATSAHELSPGALHKHSRTMSSEPYYASSRHQSDGYLSSGGGSLPDTATTPSSAGGSTTAVSSLGNSAASALHWMHGSPVHQSSHLSLGSIPSICAGPNAQRAPTLSHNDTHIYTNASAGASHSQFDCTTSQNNSNNNNNNYDSDHNSPHHENQHTSDSSSSCQSRFKNSSLILPATFNTTNNSQQQDSSRMQQIQHTTNLQITANSTCIEVKSWLAANRFNLFVKTFSNFSGSDLLRLSKTDLVEICGVIDGIRLFNSLHISQPIKHIFCDQNISLDYHHA